MSRTLKIIIINAVVFLLPSAVSAVQLNIPIGGTTSVTDLSEYIRVFYTFFVTSAGILATVMIMFGGYRWITAAGNSSKIGEAKETIISAALGLVLALTSYLILHTINPDITALKKLNIPEVEGMTGESMATRVCVFDSETKMLNGEATPVLCGEAINPVDPSTEKPKAEQCLGTWSISDENYCQVTKIGPIMSGVEKSLITITNHPSGATEFNVNNGPFYSDYKSCGMVWFEGNIGAYGGHTYQVGNSCEKRLGKRAYCYLDGNNGNFASDSSVDECSGLSGWISYFGELVQAEEIKAGCGKITNMYCAPVSS